MLSALIAVMLTGISAGMGLVECAFIYTFASVVGTIGMLPGGMGTTKANIVGLGVCFPAFYTWRKAARQTDR